MASPSPWSPYSVSGTPSSPSRRSVFQFERLGSLVMRSSTARKDYVDEVQMESDRVFSTPTSKKSLDEIHPEDYQLTEGEERRFMDPRSVKEPLVQELITILIDWINDELGDEKIRMRITNLEDDLSDGLVYKTLMEKLSGVTLSLPTGDFVQSEERRRKNVSFVVKEIEKILQVENESIQSPDYFLPPNRWSAEAILKGSILSNMHLLIAILEHFTKEGRVCLPLPKDPVRVNVVTVSKKNGQILCELSVEHLLGRFLQNKDGFDTLIDHNPEKLQFVKNSLLQFSNFHLGKIGKSIQNLENDFCDGVNFILLIGLLEGFFVPFSDYHQSPANRDEQLANMQLVYEFMTDLGGFPTRNRPSDVVNGDLKAILRVLFTLFLKYKNEEKKKSTSPSED